MCIIRHSLRRDGFLEDSPLLAFFADKFERVADTPFKLVLGDIGDYDGGQLFSLYAWL